MWIRYALTQVEKTWFNNLPAATIVVPYLSKETGEWGIQTLSDLIAGTPLPTIEEPDDPTNVVAVADSATQATVTWEHGGTGVPQGFYVYRTDANGRTLASTIYDPTARQFIDTALSPDRLYVYEVAAFNTAIRYEGLPIAASPIRTPTGTPVILPLEFTDPGTYTLIDGDTISLQLAATGGVPFTSAAPRRFQFADLDYIGEVTLAGAYTLAANQTSIGIQKTVNFIVTDMAGNTDTASLTIDTIPATLSVTNPVSFDGTAVKDEAYDSGTFTIVGGNPPFDVDFLPGPTGITLQWLTLRTFKFAGTGTPATPNTYDLFATVTDADGNSFDIPDLSIEYTVPLVTANSAPTWLSTLPDVIDLQVGTAWAGIDLDTYSQDVDGDPRTYGEVGLFDKDGNPLDLADIGLAIDGTTHVLAAASGPGSGDDALSPLLLTLYVDDGVDGPLQIVEDVDRNVVTGAAPRAGQGAVATGGSGSLSYALRNTTDSGAGTAPPWLGTLNTSTGVFPNGVTAPDDVITAGTWSFRIKATRGSEEKLTPVITVVGAAAASDDTATVIANAVYAAVFPKVYRYGVEQASREMTAGTGTSANNNDNTLRGEACSIQSSADGSSPSLEDHPTIAGKKVLMFTSKPGDGQQSGAWFTRVDGTKGTTGNGVLRKSRLYAQTTFLMSRALAAWKYQTANKMKLFYFGPGQQNGQVVVNLTTDRAMAWLDIELDGGDNMAERLGNRLAVPNPWGSTAVLTRQSPLIDNGGAFVTKSDAYRRHGPLNGGSGRGMRNDFALAYVAGEQWLDQRTYLLDGVDQGYPPQCVVDSGAPMIVMNAWNTVELFVELNTADNTKCTVQLWTAVKGQPPRLVFDNRDNVTIAGVNDADNWQIAGAMAYWTNRQPEANAPTIERPHETWILSDVPIPFHGQGGALPPGNRG